MMPIERGHLSEERSMKILLATTCAVAFAGTALAQEKTPLSDADYTKRVMKAAPAAVAEQATVVRMQKESMKTLKNGSNGWVCMDPQEATEGAGDPMCADKNA